MSICSIFQLKKIYDSKIKNYLPLLLTRLLRTQLHNCDLFEIMVYTQTQLHKLSHSTLIIANTLSLDLILKYIYQTWHNSDNKRSNTQIDYDDEDFSYLFVRESKIKGNCIIIKIKIIEKAFKIYPIKIIWFTERERERAALSTKSCVFSCWENTSGCWELESFLLQN